ncbi:YceD family protein [Altibacter sp. HG106]|uniref:YceD family protein n=1 Tax=Altibacter sp. HG106 TaxID=3023937 RepID=UPI002350A1BB|nr:DUF177 domain-containing protein [Altibacter sp. HG106]MDC7994949.1 DUF177 domain-containing protein [Altibacter sp. HG106]
MEELKEFTISFAGLKVGEHRFDFDIDNSFFTHFEYQEFNEAKIHAELLLVKKATLLELTLTFNGVVNVACDVSNEPYDQQIDGSYHFVVKYGEMYDDSEEDIIILPHGSHQINIQQQVYESIVLSIPQKRIHPGVEDGTLDSEILKKLEELQPNADQHSKGDADETDPRWDELKKLLTDK